VKCWGPSRMQACRRPVRTYESMARLPTLSRQQIERVLRKNGFEHLRNANHGHLWRHPKDASRWTLVPDRADVACGTLRSIIRDSKKSRDQFTR